MVRRSAVRCGVIKCSVMVAAAWLGLCGAAGESVAQEKSVPKAPQTLQHPIDVAVAADGTVYVADRHLPGIWKVKDGKAEVFFQASKKFRTPLNAVRCLAFDKDGNLLAGDSSTWEVYRFDKSGKPTPLAAEWIGKPMGIAVDTQGSILVADLEVQRVWKLIDGGKPKEVGQVVSPIAIAVDSAGKVVVLSRGRHQVRGLGKDGELEVIVEGQPFQFPNDMCYGKSGQLVVSDGYGKCLWRVASGKKPEKWVSASEFQNPVGIFCHGDKVYVADSRARQVWVVDAAGKVSPLVKSGG